MSNLNFFFFTFFNACILTVLIGGYTGKIAANIKYSVTFFNSTKSLPKTGIALSKLVIHIFENNCFNQPGRYPDGVDQETFRYNKYQYLVTEV